MEEQWEDIESIQEENANHVLINASADDAGEADLDMYEPNFDVYSAFSNVGPSAIPRKQLRTAVVPSNSETGLNQVAIENIRSDKPNRLSRIPAQERVYEIPVSDTSLHKHDQGDVLQATQQCMRNRSRRQNRSEGTLLQQSKQRYSDDVLDELVSRTSTGVDFFVENKLSSLYHQGINTDRPSQAVRPEENITGIIKGRELKQVNGQEQVESSVTFNHNSATTFAETLVHCSTLMKHDYAIAVQTITSKNCRKLSWSELRKYAKAISTVTQSIDPPQNSHEVVASHMQSKYVALLFDSHNPESTCHLCMAFHGVCLAGLVPVILTISSSQHSIASFTSHLRGIGFVLSSCQISLMLSDIATHKVISENTTKGVAGPAPKAWPKVHWILVDRLPRVRKHRSRNVHVGSRDEICLAFPDSESTYNTIKTVGISHHNVFNHCAAFTNFFNLHTKQPVFIIAHTSFGGGLWATVLYSTFCGYQAHIISPKILSKRYKTFWLPLKQLTSKGNIDL